MKAKLSGSYPYMHARSFGDPEQRISLVLKVLSRIFAGAALASFVSVLVCQSTNSVCAREQEVSIQTVYDAWKERESRTRSFEFAWNEKLSVSKGGFTEYTPSQFKSKDVILPTEDTVYDAAFRLVMDGAMVRAEGKEPLPSPTNAGLQDFAWILKKDLMKSFRPKGISPTASAHNWVV